MVNATRNEDSAVKTLGLVVGVVGFAGVFIAPLLAALPLELRQAGGWLLLVSGVCSTFFGRRRRWVLVVGGALAALGTTALLAGFVAVMPAVARKTLAVTVWIASWWMTVAIPIPATSLLPLVLFPLLGVLPSGATAANYANDIIFLFLGGFILALGIQRWGLHRRIALHVVCTVGGHPARIVLGFMLATGFLSMWISNTATTLMMLPIAVAVTGALREVGGAAKLGALGPALLLGVAYGASIGGLATPIGTPPNISFLRIYEILYPQAPPISFGRWFLTFLPLVLVFLPLAWLVLTRLAHRLPSGHLGVGRAVIRGELLRLGRMSLAETRMLWIFLITAVLWITRSDLELGSLRLPGWSGLLERTLASDHFESYLHDATVAMAMALLTFVIPATRDEEGRRRALMDWHCARELPWGILLLFGGGFAIASAFKESGLSEYLGRAFAGSIEGHHPLFLVVAVCTLLTFLTEVTSNTATAQVMLPVLAGSADAIGVHPLVLMLPATLSASCAFMLPIATPPNAIVFGSGEVEMRDMIRAGLMMNLLGVVLISMVFYFALAPLLGIDPTGLPQWSTR